MRDRIEDVLSILYDYEYIDIEKFYNDEYNSEMLEEFANGNDEFNEDILESLEGFIAFETNYNSRLGDF